MLQIVSTKQNTVIKEIAKEYLKFAFMKDGVEQTGETLDEFYFLVNENKIIGCCKINFNEEITGDNIYPLITSLHIKEDYRKRNYAQLLINHVIQKAELLGHTTAYLKINNLETYEIKNWTQLDLNSVQNNEGTIFYKRIDERR